MLAGLTVGIDAAATSMATKGQEGGVEEVQNYFLKQQQNQRAQQQAGIEKQKAAQEADEHDLRMKTMNANMQINMASFEHNVKMWEGEEKQSMLRTREEMTKSIMEAPQFAGMSDEELAAYTGLSPEERSGKANPNAGQTMANQPGVITNTFTKEQDQSSVMNNTVSGIPPGKTLGGDYMPVVGGGHGNNGHITLIPADNPILDRPAPQPMKTAFRNALDLAEKQAAAAGVDKDPRFVQADANAQNIIKQIDAGNPSLRQMQQLYFSTIPTMTSLVSNKMSANKIEKENAENQETQIRAKQTAQADVAYQAQHQKGEDFNSWQTRVNEEAKRKIDEGDPKAASDMIKAGLMAPSQVLGRVGASRPFQQAVIRELGGSTNLMKAEAQYRYAENPQTQNTLNMIQAMNDKGGSIEIAQTQFNAIPGKIDNQAWNKIVQGTQTQFGGKDIVGFRTAMLGLADEYSKVMGGGVSSDTGRKQALDLIGEAYSKGQGARAIDVIHQDIAARKKAIVGDNPTLQAMFPDAPLPKTSTKTPAQAPSDEVLKNGVVIGYVVEGKYVALESK
jgi:hypothetical protein